MPFFSKFKSSKPSLALPNSVREGSGAGSDPPKPKPKYRHIPIHAATDSLSGSWAMEDRYKSFTEQEQMTESCSSLHTTSFLLRGEGSSSCLSSSSTRPVEQTSEVTDSEDGKLTDPYLCMGRADGRTPRSFPRDHDFESVSSSNDESMAYSRYASSSFQSAPSSSISTLSSQDRHYKYSPRKSPGDKSQNNKHNEAWPRETKLERLLGSGVPTRQELLTSHEQRLR